MELFSRKTPVDMESTQKKTDQLQALIHKVLQHFAGEAFRDEVRFAKSEFFDNAGILEEQSEQFELRMSQFFEWYFFSRDLRGFSAPPLKVCHTARELRFSAEEIELLENLKAHRHGVFEFIKLKGNDVYLRDLLKGDKLVVRETQYNQGFDPDELFQVRLFPVGDNWVFSKGFCFHPQDAKKFIFSEVKRHRKDPDLNPEELLLRLIKMRYKYERYRHVDIDRIYNNNAT